MSSPEFAHLHLHTQYSLLDGAIKINDLVKKAKEYGMNSVAITDHGNMFGAIEFYLECKKHGLKPIIGSEVYVAPASRTERSGHEDASAYHLILLCQDMAGYRNLSHLVSAGFKEGFYGKPRVDKELLAKHSDGLICLSACLKGEIAYLATRGKLDAAIESATWYAEQFPGRYYLELQENTIPEQSVANERLMQIADQLALPLVATNDCHYLSRDDAKSHEVLLCIQTGKTMQDEKRMRFSAEEFYVKTPAEMAAAFSYAPGAVSNTLEIAELCNLDLPADGKTFHFPNFEPPPGSTHDQMLEDMAVSGLTKRLETIRIKTADLSPEKEKAYRDRLRLELDCIIQMKFPAYFLIVADFINWAKDNGIPVGPGRGSAAGSLVAYAISITDLDPLPYNLLFERFLNPERVSMPDIDVDFCQSRRDEVIQYVVEKYGRDRVCQIITFGTMAARSVIRDVGRALGMEYGKVDRIAKLIPETADDPTKKVLLADVIKQDGKFKEEAKDPAVKELLDIALNLEGLARNASTHAAGVVMTPGRFEDYCPVYMDRKSGALNTQYSMAYVDKIGLVKFDFLGLRNLTVIENAVKLVRAEKAPAFDIKMISDDDKSSYDLISNGNTTGVFQFESRGMKEMLVKLKPSCFEDIIAACALYRPGPLGSGMVNDFIERKHGRKKVVYDLPELEPILKDTYGVIVYQEQVMQISRTLAGYSLGKADLLRRAMGKKDQSVMAKEKAPFLDGAKQLGINLRKAEAIFDLMAKFAEYGFNKSHSAAYALVSYQTAYLKAHYPVEFMASLLSCDSGVTAKVVKSIADCREMGIEVLPPDINASFLSFRVIGNSIRFGLGAVKNVGEGAIESIIDLRSDTPYKDIFDFCERIDSRKVNKRVIESLIMCGAFDSTGARRSQLMAALDNAINLGARLQQERESTQTSLFGNDEIIRTNGKDRITIELPDIPEWDSKFRLEQEKETLGFYATGHPLERYFADMKRFVTTDTAGLAEVGDKKEVRLCGVVTGYKEIIIQKNGLLKGKKMGVVMIEDAVGSVEVAVFPEAFAAAEEILKGEEPIVISGTVDVGEKGTKIKATDVALLSELATRSVKQVTFTLSAEGLDRSRLEKLREIIYRHPGDCTTQIIINVPAQFRAALVPDNSFKVAPSMVLAQETRDLFGYEVMSTSTACA